jgi:hypothetical protein
MTAATSLAPDVRGMALTRLRDAQAKFQCGELNGREGAGIALLILRSIAASALGLQATDPLLSPINALHDGLNQLDDGATPDLFKPSKKAGPPRTSQGEADVKALALFTVHMLIEQGVDRKDARKAVAKQLNDSGFERRNCKGPLTERTVREWDESARAYPERETAMLFTILLRSRPIELSGRTPHARAFLRDSATKTQITPHSRCGKSRLCRPSPPGVAASCVNPADDGESE